MRRFKTPHEFRPYPFGALVLYTHPTDAAVPGSQARSDKRITKKWRDRLVPSIFVVVSVGPGGQWSRSYRAVPVASLLSENRASRVSIRSVADVRFTEVVSFLLQQRFTLHAAFDDTTLPAPMVTDSTEKWEVIVEERADDLFKYDGMCKENIMCFQKTTVVELMMAIDPGTAPDDPDTAPDDRADTPGAQGPANDYAAVEPDV